jgi:hypothetical protein
LIAGVLAISSFFFKFLMKTKHKLEKLKKLFGSIPDFEGLISRV